MTIAPLNSVSREIRPSPLLEFGLTVRGEPRRVFAKAEWVHRSGSIKDRLAAHVVNRAREEGTLLPGAPIVEASSGNTAIAFASLGAATGHPVTIFMPDWMSRERTQLLVAFGARVVPVSREQGGFVGSVALAHEHALEVGAFEPRQFDNPWNVEAHELGTGVEILRDLAAVGLAPDAFVAGVGTGGTVMGVGRALRKAGLRARVHPVEPAESPILTVGHNVGRHRIQGISDEFVPSIVRLEELDAPIGVSDRDAIVVAQKMARELGVGVGISSGANVMAAIALGDELGPDAVVTTVLSDDHSKYLSTDLFAHETARPGSIAEEVRFRSVRVVEAPAA